MSAGLRNLWPALPAALILYFGAADFIDRFPQAREGRAERRSGSGPDTLVALARAFAADTQAAAAPAGENPFRPIRPARGEPSRGGGGMRIEPPPRNYVLKGTVGSDVATIADNSGERRIMRAGDRIDSAVVVSIAPNRVVLRDRAGTFELKTER